MCYNTQKGLPPPWYQAVASEADRQAEQGSDTDGVPRSAPSPARELSSEKPGSADKPAAASAPAAAAAGRELVATAAATAPAASTAPGSTAANAAGSSGTGYSATAAGVATAAVDADAAGRLFRGRFPHSSKPGLLLVTVQRFDSRCINVASSESFTSTAASGRHSFVVIKSAASTAPDPRPPAAHPPALRSVQQRWSWRCSGR